MRVALKRNQKFHFSPLRYPGGKSFLYPFLNKLIEKKGLSNISYIEPFAGGAGAGLALLFLEKVDRIVINDLDPAIYAFWQAAITETDRFIDKMYSTRITIREWRKQKAIYQDHRSSNFDFGFATFFLNRTNISGIVEGGPIGGMKQLGKWPIDARFNKINLADKIETIGNYRNRITVFNKDGYDLIKRFLNKKEAFIYLDPPYFEKGASLYLNHYQQSDHERLARRLNSNPKTNWVLTYDNTEVIKSLYKEQRRFCFSLYHNAYKSRKGEEILILSNSLVSETKL